MKAPAMLTRILRNRRDNARHRNADELQMSVDPPQIVEVVGYALPRDGRIAEIGSRRANGKIAYLQFKFEDSFIWSASTKNDPLASVPKFLQSR
jgi:hypothetical protein